MKNIIKYVLTIFVIALVYQINVFAEGYITFTVDDIDFLHPTGTAQSIYIQEEITTSNVQRTAEITVKNFEEGTKVYYYWIDLSKDGLTAANKIRQYQTVVKTFNAASIEEKAAMADELNTWDRELVALFNSDEANDRIPDFVLNSDDENMQDWKPLKDVTYDANTKTLKGNFLVPVSDSFTDNMLIWVRVQGERAGKDEVLYMFRLYNNELPADKAGNPDTGISNPFVIIVPLAILAGSVIVFKKKRYA
jgi:hypothetical protein